MVGKRLPTKTLAATDAISQPVYSWNTQSARVIPARMISALLGTFTSSPDHTNTRQYLGLLRLPRLWQRWMVFI